MAASRTAYLDIEAVVDAGLGAGAAAVHPGYGFLAENADFAERVVGAGMVFVGPSPQVLRCMGDKAQAKELATKAGVPVVPGHSGARRQGFAVGPTGARGAARAAEKIGYPVLVKAAAGGGGRGMRIAAAPGGLVQAMESAAREAQAAFGDGRLILEKYIANPRHIEVQVFADGTGRTIHMGTRDCSVQRRYQKIVEEAPAPNLDPKLEAQMTKAATRLAKAVGYEGAGTVEFIVDREDRFAFLEMNTRLQVEHPVTEAVTGEDLVAWQLLIAAGRKLPKGQKEIAITGHAIEARLCAEDPARDFMPSAGRLHHLELPSDSVRVDTGYRAGDTVPVHFDNLIAKIIAHAPDRKAALGRLRHALGSVRVVGPATNAGFLVRVAKGIGFAAGRYDTGLVARGLDRLTAPTAPGARVLAAAAVAAALDRMKHRPAGWASPWHDEGGWRLFGVQERRVELEHSGARFEVALVRRADGTWTATPKGGEKLPVRPAADGTLVVGGRPVRLARIATAAGLHFFASGDPVACVPVDPLARGETDAQDSGALTAPMPARIAHVAVAVGDRVAAGDLLMVLEAMKMEHSVLAPAAGRITGLAYARGDQVARGAELVRMEEEAGP
ncbi:MAG: ATP-grasp domain-containing protein [Alphaproteobacteria bacterium]|nr:ATP-grasp domain-containing protein [Alphaproteobacteria bacterium]